MPVTRKPRTTLAPISVRTFSSRSGRIGFSIRDSSQKNAASRIAADADEADRVRGGPAVLGRGHDRVDGEHHRRGHEHRAGDVDTAAQAGSRPVLDQPRAEREHGDADRQVDVEDPVPVDGLHQRAAEQQAERAAGGDDEHVGAHRADALVRAREVGDDQGDDHRGGDRAAEALQEAGGDQHDLVVGQPAEGGGNGEEGEAGEEDLLATDQVAEPAGHQQEAPVGDEVGADDPGEVGLREVQVTLDDGQGDVDDRHVDDHHQLPETDDDQRHPLAPRGGAI